MAKAKKDGSGEKTQVLAHGTRDGFSWKIWKDGGGSEPLPSYHPFSTPKVRPAKEMIFLEIKDDKEPKDLDPTLVLLCFDPKDPASFQVIDLLSEMLGHLSTMRESCG